MQKCKKLYRGLDMRILTCYNNIMHPGIAKLVSRLVWDQETVRSSRTTRTNEKRDSEIADFRAPFSCSMSTARLDPNPSKSTGLGSSPGQIQEHHVLLHSTSERH